MHKAEKLGGISRVARSRSKRDSSNHKARPTPERLKKSEGAFDRGDSGQITMRDSPLERALSRKLISREQYAAGQKYRHHWYHAGLCDPLASVDLDHVFGCNSSNSTSGMAKSENQFFHRERYREAVQAIGKIGSHVLDSAICREINLQSIGQALGWSNERQAYAAAMERLKQALDTLSKLWGIALDTHSAA
jgi:hypothetical protein